MDRHGTLPRDDEVRTRCARRERGENRDPAPVRPRGRADGLARKRYAHVLARPLIEEVQRQIARRGAWALTQLSWDGNGGAWMREASDELLREPAPLKPS